MTNAVALIAVAAGIWLIYQNMAWMVFTVVALVSLGLLIAQKRNGNGER